MSESRAYDLGSAILRGIEIAVTLYVIRFFVFWLTSVGLLGFVEVDDVNTVGIIIVGLGFVVGFYQIYRREEMPNRKDQVIYIVTLWILGLLWFSRIPLMLFPFSDTTVQAFSVYGVTLMLLIGISYLLAYRRPTFQSGLSL